MQTRADHDQAQISIEDAPPERQTAAVGRLRMLAAKHPEHAEFLLRVFSNFLEEHERMEEAPPKSPPAQPQPTPNRYNDDERKRNWAELWDTLAAPQLDRIRFDASLFGAAAPSMPPGHLVAWFDCSGCFRAFGRSVGEARAIAIEQFLVDLEDLWKSCEFADDEAPPDVATEVAQWADAGASIVLTVPEGGELAGASAIEFITHGAVKQFEALALIVAARAS